MRQIDAGSTGGPVVGLRVALGAGLLAAGWLVLGAVAGGASAAELEIGDGSLLGPDSSFAIVAEPIQDIGMDAGPRAAVSGADVPVVAGTSVLSDVADAANVQKLAEPVLKSVDPVLETVEPVLESVEPVLDVIEPVLDVIEPVLESVEPVLESVGAEATVFGTQPASILVVPERALADQCGGGCDLVAAQPRTHVRGDFPSSSSRSAAASMTDPARHVPGPSAPLTPLSPSETVAPGASGSIAIPSNVAERGWDPCAPRAHTMPPGNDIPPAAPAFDSDSTPD